MVKVDHIAHDMELPEGVTATVSGTVLKITKGNTLLNHFRILSLRGARKICFRLQTTMTIPR